MWGIFLWQYLFLLLSYIAMKRRLSILFAVCACALGHGVYAETDDKPLVVETRYADWTKQQEAKKEAAQKVTKKNESTTITMSALDAVRLAGRLVDMHDYDQATRILTMMPQTNNLPVEIERWYLIAQIAQRQGDLDTAIKIYRKILDDQPDLVKVRYELALCYMAKQQWYRADYHLRLAMAGADIPPQIKQQMMYYRWIARQNKTWNVWFNFGAAPDNNVNQASGYKLCGTYGGGFVGCADVIKPVRDIGYNLLLGGNYEFRLTPHWRWKSDANIYANIYEKYHEYDDLYLSGSTGPRYVWQNGDIWLAGVAARRWYGGDKYYKSAGGKLDTNYDWTRKLSTGISLRVMNNQYDDENYARILNGQTYSGAGRVSYSLDATKYLILRGGMDRDTAKRDYYANWRYNAAIGFGSELPWGFHAYIEPSFSWTNYDAPRWVVVVDDNSVLKQVKKTERDFTQRYALSLSNNKFDVWGFVPTLTFSYTKRDSNIKNREYDKATVEFTMQQRF